MMHLQFVSIRLIRFRSFQDEAIFYFDDAGPGLYFLKGKNKADNALGSNGAGKSSIIDSLLWCLYGKTVQGLKNPDIIPWSGKGKTEVEVTFLIDNKQYKIKRTVGPNKLSIDDSESGQEYVSKLISIPFEIIPYTIILGQKQPLFFDLTASEKLKLFSEILNLDRWEERSVHASEVSNNLQSEIDARQIELTSAINAQRQASSDFDSLKQQSRLWEQNRAEKLSNAEKDKKRIQDQIAGVMNARDTADLKLDRALTELKALKLALDGLRSEEREISRTTDSLTANHRQLASKQNQLVSMLESIQDKNCPTCNQAITSAQQRKKLEQNLKDQIKALNGEKLEREVKTALLLARKNQEQIEIQIAAKEQFEKDVEEARDVLDRLLPQIARWEAELAQIDKDLATNESSDNPYTDQLQVLRRRRDQNKAQAENAEKIIKTKTEYLERTRFWVKGFKDIKLLQVEEILQELDIVTNSMCEESGLVGWQVKYDIERETKAGTIARGLNITVLSPSNKHAVKWEVWSGGEAQRLRLIGTAALSSVLLNHVGVTTNLEVFDEPTIGLSREGVQDLVEMLAQRARQTSKNILLVDHHVIESSHFTQVIQVTKDKKGSYLEIV